MIKQVLLILSVLFFCACSTSQEETKFIVPENSYSIQDVVYTGEKDSVLYAKQNGQIFHLVKDQEPSLVFDLNEEVHFLAYNEADKKIYVSTYQSGIAVIDERTKKLSRRLPVSEWSHSILYHEKTGTLFNVGTDLEIAFWNVKKGYENEKLNISQQMVTAGDFQGGRVVFAGLRGNVILYNPETKEVVDKGRVQVGVNDESAVHDGKMMWSRNTSKAYLIDIGSMQVVGEVQHPNWPIKTDDTSYVEVPVSLDITGVALSEDRAYTASSDRSIRVWSLPDLELLETLKGHHGIISTIKLNRRHDQLVSVSLRGEIKFWDLNKPNDSITLHYK